MRIFADANSMFNLLKEKPYEKTSFYCKCNRTGDTHQPKRMSNQVDEIEVGEILAETARKVGGYTYSISSTHPYGTWNTEMGYGLLDAYAAVQEAKARLN